MEIAPKDWEQIKAFFNAALEQPPSQRSAYLAQQCPDVYRKQVETLLRDHERAQNFLSVPPFEHRGIAIAHSASTINAQVETSETHGLPVLNFQVRHADHSESEEIEQLLHRRLRIIVLIAIGVHAFFNALRLVRLSPLLTTNTVYQLWIPAALNLLALVVIAIILGRRKTYSLRRLRWIELAAFGIATLYFLGETYTTLFSLSGGWLITYSQRHLAEISILARQPSINWMVIIIGYGTFIPNTGRRCALVTGAMAFSALILVAIAGLFHPAVPRKALLVFLAEMGMWMGCAVAMAIYGSHKITVLREQALQARKLGQYHLKKLVGKGGMGEVYLAEHVLLKRPCAVKVIRHDQTNDPGMLKRFLREVQVTATLTHPNTVQVFDYGQADDGTVFYAMEFLDGLTLDQMVKNYGSMPPARAVHILRQLCGALAEAHAIGLIHRDIKPTNVILCRRWGQYDVAKLLDFGLVRTSTTEPGESGKTLAGMILGSPAFMSPEQALGNSSVDARSDIYSLGALAYFLIAAEPPFVRKSIVETLAAHIGENPKPLRSIRPTLPADLEKIVQRCLEKSCDRRFADASALGQALAGCSLAGHWNAEDAAVWWKASIPA